MAAEKAIETRGKTGLEDAEKNDILQRLWRSFKTSKKSCRQCKMPTFAFKEFNEKFYFKRITGISTEKYQAFVERFQKSYELTDEKKDELLDALDAGENDGMLCKFDFKEGKGKIHHGRVATMKKDGKIDFAFAVYQITFELPETKDWVYKWSLYMIPTGWKYKTEAQMLTQEQKDGFSEWCKWKLQCSVEQECL